jgi:ClpX C4-type zinc finger
MKAAASKAGDGEQGLPPTRTSHTGRRPAHSAAATVPQCNFCGKSPPEIKILFANPPYDICVECDPGAEQGRRQLSASHMLAPSDGKHLPRRAVKPPELFI